MKRQLIILSAIILGIFFLSFLYYFLFQGGDWRNWGILLLPLVLLIIPAFVITFLIIAIIHKYKIYSVRLLIGTNLLGLVIGVCFILFNLYEQWHYNNYEANVKNNESYKQFYDDSRDTFVTLAIHAIEKKQQELNDYGIYEMGVTERDTLYKGSSIKYYIVNQIYFLGKEFSKDKAYISKHFIYGDNTVQELYDKPLLADSIGLIEWQKHKAFINKMEKSIDGSLKDSSKEDETLLKAKKVIKKLKQ
jgi:hypothetical protein